MCGQDIGRYCSITDSPDHGRIDPDIAVVDLVARHCNQSGTVYQQHGNSPSYIFSRDAFCQGNSKNGRGTALSPARRMLFFSDPQAAD
jgi:hypothetical protein